MRQTNRVVITGVGAVTPFGVREGRGVEPLIEGLRAKRSAVTQAGGWREIGGLECLVAARVPDFDEKSIDRKYRRSMGRTAMFGAAAAKAAVVDAGLSAETLASGRVGVSFGSTTGSPAAHAEFFDDVSRARSIEGLKSMYLLKSMSHTSASNVAQYLGVNGRLICSCVACATATQAIGLGCEAVRHGEQDAMICGGSDEVHFSTVCSFALIQAASTRYNDAPGRTPRPFDRDRDGVVCGEGSGAVVIERYDSAVARGARIYAEVLGFDTSVDGANIAHPDADSMAGCLRRAIAAAGIGPRDVEYVSAHATGTEFGDSAEARAIVAVCGEGKPVSSFKGHIGHTLGACGAIELIGALEGMRRGLLLPTLNLDTVDEACKGLDHVVETRETKARVLLKNSFALGGVNSALVVAI